MKLLRPVTLALAVLAAAGCATLQDAAVAPNTLLAAKVITAPSLDAGAADPVWVSAKPLRIDLAGGENFGGKGSTTMKGSRTSLDDDAFHLVA